MKLNILGAAFPIAMLSTTVGASWCSIKAIEGSKEEIWNINQGFCWRLFGRGSNIFKCWNPELTPCCDVGESELEYRRMVQIGFVVCRKNPLEPEKHELPPGVKAEVIGW